MPLIKPNNDELLQRRYRFSKSLLDEINDYCEWAGVKNDNQFLEEAAMYVLKKDRDWQKAKSKLKKEKSHS